MNLHVAADDLENLIIFIRDIIKAETQWQEQMRRSVFFQYLMILWYPPEILMFVQNGL